ncbi:MAG: DUF3179 domain-containing protein [Spirochaetes bacterium]|nr:DUF3179 domain-containing protein [Spirochaetota bacterium]
MNFLFIILFQFYSNTRLNGFLLNNPLIPVEQIKRGGPPRDGIPAIDQPRFISVAQVDFLNPEDKIIGLNYQGVIKAYPIKILNWHEIVNDKTGNQNIIITYCPLCGSGVIFNGNLNGKNYSFGVSGLLYNSDVLLYDRETESLWSQLKEQAISGPQKGEMLKKIPAEYLRWADWKKKYPHAKVLSTETGYSRNYQQDPYLGYAKNPRIWFEVENQSDQFFSKEIIYGLKIDDFAKAYPINLLNKKNNTFTDQFAHHKITIKRIGQGAYQFYDSQGNVLPVIQAFWFAWYTFHPQTEIFQ